MAFRGNGAGDGIKILADNRRARRLYRLSDPLEVGIVLSGAVVKSCRAGKIQLADAYAAVKDNELWLFNAHISHYGYARDDRREPTARRKLLAHRRQIDRLAGKVREKGRTLIPTKVYLAKGRVKLEIALAQGKQLHDRREEKKKAIEKEEARDAVGRRGRPGRMRNPA